MARGVLAPNQISRTGVALAAETNGDASNGHQTANDGLTTFVLAHNSGAGARWVKFLVSKTVDGIAVTAPQRSLTAGQTKLFGPFPTGTYGSTLQIDVEHAEMKLAVYRF